MDIQKNLNDSKIIESMGIPRADVEINRKIAKFYVLLHDKLGDIKDVYFCDYSNLFYRGQVEFWAKTENISHNWEKRSLVQIYKVLGETTGQSTNNRPFRN